jgi:site-specific DNA-methyltransferase (adenine-specific)/adenine-specific DNA-methyltransferase
MPSLQWIGKKAVETHHRDVPFHLLEPVAEHSAGDADSGNLIIQGDNLVALKALLPKYAGKVKCIYIDPPYNTGNEGWAYNDNVNSPEIKKWLGEVVGKEGETLDRHDRWLCMMYPRLYLLRKFLREDGAIFISIDDNEQANLKLICDDIFGAANHITSIPWQSRMSIQGDTDFSINHEYIIVYSKNRRKGNRRFKESNADVWLQHDSFVFKPLPVNEEKYSNPDNDSRGKWKADPFDAPNIRHNLTYPIINPNTGIEYLPPKGRHWRMTYERFCQALTDDRIVWGKNGKSKPQLKVFYEEKEAFGSIDNSWFNGERVGTATSGTKELQDIFGGHSPFDTPKPSTLIKKLIDLGFVDKNDIVLDSFAGSGTTAHAVLKQNAEDGGNRKFILVEMDKTISVNVTAERVKRVALGYTNAKGETVNGLGGGFQFCRLSTEPLFNAEGAIRQNVSFNELAEFIWFMETGTGNLQCSYAQKASPLLGVYHDKAIYLLYNGILADRSDLGGNTLNSRTLDYLTAFVPNNFAGQHVIYGARCRFDKATLSRMGIIFKQLPYDLAV